MIEAVPNFSEGRNRETIDAVADAISSSRGVRLLHLTSDVDHNRSVITYASRDAEAMVAATLRLYEAALPRIDLRRHQGEHPRIGAVDVVPFVPLPGTEMLECVQLAERVGREIAARFDLPVYLYEHAARQEHRRHLPAIRSGGFERFPDKIREARWQPDFGPPRVHPSAGVTVVGARAILIAFNVQLATDRIEVARSVARKVRASSGGLPFVRALPIRLAHRGVVQVSMNLLDYRETPLRRVFDAVRDEARQHGVEVKSSEIVGLVPGAALFEGAAEYLMIENFSPDIILENRVAQVFG